VLLRFSAKTPARTVDEIFAGLDGLRRKIPGVLDFSGGAYKSNEGLNKGFTHGFVMTFADAAARDAYLTHPEHEAIKQKVLPLLEGGLDGAIAFDWEMS
jgi:hypothetical protein